MLSFKGSFPARVLWIFACFLVLQECLRGVNGSTPSPSQSSQNSTIQDSTTPDPTSQSPQEFFDKCIIKQKGFTAILAKDGCLNSTGLKFSVKHSNATVGNSEVSVGFNFTSLLGQKEETDFEWHFGTCVLPMSRKNQTVLNVNYTSLVEIGNETVNAKAPFRVGLSDDFMIVYKATVNKGGKESYEYSKYNCTPFDSDGNFTFEQVVSKGIPEAKLKIAMVKEVEVFDGATKLVHKAHEKKSVVWFWVGIICGSVFCVGVVVGVIIFLVCRHIKNKKLAEENAKKGPLNDGQSKSYAGATQSQVTGVTSQVSTVGETGANGPEDIINVKIQQ